MTIPLAVGAILILWQLRITPFAHALSVVPIAIMLGQLRDRISTATLKPALAAGAVGFLITPLPIHSRFIAGGSL